jgi:hypothetical protein
MTTQVRPNKVFSAFPVEPSGVGLLQQVCHPFNAVDTTGFFAFRKPEKSGK